MLEPIEEVVVDVETEYTGLIIEKLTQRKGELKEYKDTGVRSKLMFHVPSRALMGFRSEALMETRGSAMVHTVLDHYAPYAGTISGMRRAKLVSMDSGTTTAYALSALEDRGELFVGDGEDVYPGVVVGESSRTTAGDIDVNPCKGKKLTNVRAAGTDEALRLTPPKRRTVEELIAYMDGDEVLEVTPETIRLRKKILDPGERARVAKKGKKAHLE